MNSIEPTTTESVPAQPRRSRRWLRFSLRSVLVSVTLLCIALGWWTHRAHQQRRIVERIEASGGYVEYDPYDDGYFEVRVVRQRISDALGPDFVYDVWAAGVGDHALLPDLRHLRKLQFLEVFGERMTDEDMRSLADLHGVTVLGIRCNVYSFHTTLPTLSELGDGTLEAIGQMAAIEAVDIEGIDISPKGLQALARATTLTEVNVRWCRGTVTEADADVFKSSGRVRELSIWRWDDIRGEELVVHW